jgi:hypothetical protein
VLPNKYRCSSAAWSVSGLATYTFLMRGFEEEEDEDEHAFDLILF